MSKQARHMVIPYMPMLVPPQNWTGYGIQLSIKISGYLINLTRGCSWAKGYCLIIEYGKLDHKNRESKYSRYLLLK